MDCWYMANYPITSVHRGSSVLRGTGVVNISANCLSVATQVIFK